MTYTAEQQRQTEHQTMTADQLVKRFVELRDHVTAQQKKFDEFLKPFKAEQVEIQDKLLAMLNQTGGESIKTEHGTASKSTITTPKVEARDAYLDWLFALSDADWDAFGNAMLQIAAPQIDAVREYMGNHEGQLPPGVVTSSFTRVNVRRS